MPVRSDEPQPSAVDTVETARMLRALLVALPPTTARDRATARRIEGAAVALDAITEPQAATRST